MVVLAIIGIVISIAIPNYLHAIDRAKQARAMEELNRWSQALRELYPLAVFPPALDLTAVAKSLGSDAHDPWGGVYVYTGLTDGYELRCYCKDRKRSEGITPQTRNQFDLDIVMVNGTFVNKPMD